ncbi:MAG: aryl-sulfate sulfotransferase [Planctomycetes bacterium]|nr:aryl-sulfate sulfotransferase [Planctomycetota bacterium]
MRTDTSSQRSPSRVFLCALAFSTLGAVTAQTPAPGHRVFGSLNGTDTWLVDAKGAIVHTWSSTFTPGLAVHVEPDGTLLRTIDTGKSTLAGAGGGLQRVALDGALSWDFRYDGPGVLSHHDVTALPNGNVLMIAWEDKTPTEALAAGRDPTRVPTVLLPEHIIEVQQTGPSSGAIVWEWHVWDHLIQDIDPTRANFGVVGAHPELVDINYPPTRAANGDWLHCNGIDYDPIHDRIILSTLNAAEIWVIDHSTTTAEAASHRGGRWGKGGDLLYRWGNPQAYRAGTGQDQVFHGQHSPRFVPAGYPGAGNLTVFLNRLNNANQSAVYELIPPLDSAGNFRLDASGRYGPTGPTWSYTATGFFSTNVSSAERLPNGNTLICSGRQRHVFEVTPSGSQVASHTVPGPGALFNAEYVDRWLWSKSDALSVSPGGSIDLDLVTGSQHAGSTYWVLGTLSGTTPGLTLPTVHVPLNVDSWTWDTIAYPNTALLARTLGVLDTNGRASASLLTVRPGLIPPALIGLRFDHAYIVIDQTNAITFASNPVAFSITR